MQRYLVKSLAALTLVYSQLGLCEGADNPLLQEVIPEHHIHRYTTSSPDGDVSRQLYAGSRKWENHRKLKVCFFGGDRVLVKLVREVASEWNDYSGVTLDFGKTDEGYNCSNPSTGFAPIRIQFTEAGYWSSVGTYSEKEDADNRGSMNLGGFKTQYNERRYTMQNVVSAADEYHKAVIRHEFGHALGLLHEQQNPALDCIKQIKWTGPGNVYDYYEKPPNNWDASDVKRNLGAVNVTDPDYVTGEPDTKSIMMYYLDPSIFVNGATSKCASAVNYKISERDKALISKMYPRANIAVNITEDNLSKAMVAPPPAIINGEPNENYVQKLTNDILSEDAFTRRNARARLANYIKSDPSSGVASELVKDMSKIHIKDRYRFQLGVTNAISNAGETVKLSKDAVKVIEEQKAITKDPTLIKNFEAVQKKTIQE